MGPFKLPPQADEREPADAEGAISAARAGAVLVAGWVIIGADGCSVGARRRPLAECLLTPFRVGARFPRLAGRCSHWQKCTSLNESGALPALLDPAGWSSPIARRKVT